MSKVEPIKIEDNEVKKAIQSGHPYIQVDAKKYLLMEVEEVNDYSSYSGKRWNFRVMWGRWGGEGVE